MGMFAKADPVCVHLISNLWLVHSSRLHTFREHILPVLSEQLGQEPGGLVAGN